MTFYSLFNGSTIHYMTGNLGTMSLTMLLMEATPTSVPTTAAGWVLLALGLLLSSGALVWFIRSGTDVKFAVRDAKEAKTNAQKALTKSEVLESRVNAVDLIIQEIRTRMGKLDKVDEMVAAVEFIKQSVTVHMVPRSEHERQWMADNDRFGRIEDDIRVIKEQIHEAASN